MDGIPYGVPSEGPDMADAIPVSVCCIPSGGDVPGTSGGGLRHQISCCLSEGSMSCMCGPTNSLRKSKIPLLIFMSL